MTEVTKPQGDRARYSLALLGFYASCAAVSGGAAMFFFALFVLTKAAYDPLPAILKILGSGLVLIGGPGAFFCLSRARRPKDEAPD